MSIEKITNPYGFDFKLIDQKAKISGEEASNPNMFDAILKASSKMYEETNVLQKNANDIQIAFATGQTDNVLDVMLAQEKALTSINYTVQITNKVVDAYKEIMQIQI